MSSQGESRRPVKGYTRDSRRRNVVLDVDLNDTPPCENRTQEETIAAIVLPQESSDQGVAMALPPVATYTIDVEAISDDVVISSPRTFAEARNNSRRNHTETVILDEDAEGHQGPLGFTLDESLIELTFNSYKRRRFPPNQTVINCELTINLEGSPSAEGERFVKPPEPTQGMPAPPVEPTFSCPVCMGALIEETSTKCGHIFCKSCINAAIMAQGKCPTCRRKLKMKDTFRVFLPTTS